MKKIKMILTAKDDVPPKDSLQKISEKQKLDLPAYFGKNLINFNKNDLLYFSTYDTLSNKNNIEALLNSDPADWDDHGNINDCQNIKNNNSEMNIFLIPFDMDGRPPNLYKIEETKEQDKYFFNTHLMRDNIFMGPEIVNKSLKIKKKIKTHQFEINNNKLVIFCFPYRDPEKNEKISGVALHKKELLKNKDKFLPTLLENNKACEINVKNGKYHIYSFYDYQFGDEDVSGFGCYGHLIELK